MDFVKTWRSEILVHRSDGVENSLYAERTDKQLVELTLAGDESAFECIFARHKRYVAVIASRYFRCPDEIEEVIQTCFIKAYFDLENFRGLNDHSLVSWLGRITRNTCLNLRRSRTTTLASRFTDLPESMSEIIAADLKEKSAEELTSQRDLLEKLFASLCTEDRALLQMLHAEELSITEVAETFGWSRAKVKVKAFRARRHLRKILKRFL
ncbi:MAG TPA: RNA polymerase sigma factor [Pyrinomonadaceae bacterium]|jgi:RNA polymerase sigma-70 factor (ECF subfamily)|nr:RNA polymerase sigma factor [Pyrinomonadaceae bacterium]